LPIPAEINARLIPHGEQDDSVDLKAIWIFPMILAPRRFLGEADQIWARNVMMMTELGTSHAGEKRFGGIRIDFMLAAEAISFFMVDAM
jgi:hypothetical protein